MTSPGPRPTDLNDLATRLQRLEARLDESDRRTLGSTGISSGQLVVRNGAEFSVLHEVTGAWVLHVGHGALNKYFLTIRRDDGTAVFEVGTAGDGNQFGALWDRNQNQVVGDDATSGVGLARPYLPYTVSRARYTDWLGSTSGSFEALWKVRGLKQHPKVLLALRHTTDVSGTTGEIEVRDNVTNTVLGTSSVTFVQAFAWLGPYAVSGGHLATDVEIQVSARRTAGTGAVRVEVAYMMGVQS